MVLDQLPAHVREFVKYLDGLLARLDRGGGWCAVFWQRDPDGMQACLDGREVPPWDVVAALLQDLGAQYGPGGAGPETERARVLHAAALAACDAQPGARNALGDRLDVMLREQEYAAERQAELGRLLASAATREEADALRLDLAWARDDHERATARCAELRARMAELDRRAQDTDAIRRERVGSPADGGFPTDGTPSSGHGSYGAGEAGMPHQRDARSAEAAEANDWAGPRTGQRSAAGTADWRGAAGAGDLHHGRPSGRTGRGAGDGAADWREATDVRDPHHGRSAGEVSPGRVAADWRKRAAGAAAANLDGPAPGPTSEEHSDAQSPVPGSRLSPPHRPIPDPTPTPAPKQRKRRRGSARFAGMAEEEAAPVVVPPTAVPTLPAPAAGRTPRGARFAGAAEAVERPERQPKPPDAGGRPEVAAVVERLVRLRGEGRSGEAHALLVETAYWPAARFPLLAAEMQRAGLGADWASLLWEAASLPADRLVAASDALVAAGRGADGQQILRQGVARPAGEIGQAVLGLVDAGRRREARALLDAYVWVRTPEEAARSAAPDPQRLVPLLLEAAQGVSDERHWDLLHALRVAGFAT